MLAQGWVIDKDGTLVNGGLPIDGASNFLKRISARPFLIVSNTGERESQEVALDLSAKLDVSITPDRVLTARSRLSNALRHVTHLRILVLGVGGLVGDVEESFRQDISVPDDASKVLIVLASDGYIEDYYACVTKVAAWVRAGANLWASSADTSIRDKHGQYLPGPGIFLEAVCTLAEKPVSFVRTFGKGSKSDIGGCVIDKLRQQGFNGPTRDIMLVGDRFDTDMETGIECQFKTCLVETGCDSFLKARRRNHIDHVAHSVSELANYEHSSLLYIVFDRIRDTLRLFPKLWGIIIFVFEFVAERLPFEVTVARRIH